MHNIIIDLETYSGTSIDDGVYRYVEDPDFEILLIGYRDARDEATTLIDLTNNDDCTAFRDALEDPSYIKYAFNAQFERVCLSKFFGLDLDVRQWRCLMTQAAASGLPGSLEGACSALGIEGKQTGGKTLINYFTKPCKPTNRNGGRTRNLPEHDTEKWQQFKSYCVQDVDAETNLYKQLCPLVASEQQAYEIDQDINDLGIALDPILIDQAITFDTLYRDELLAEAQELTSLDNPNSISQLKQWLSATDDIEVDSLNKKAIPELIANTNDPAVQRALELRQELSKTSVKKYTAMAKSICADGRGHGFLRFYGAGRTGRWTGRLVQVQNLPQNHLKDLDTARKLLREGEFDMLRLLYSSPLDILSQLIRTAFVPAKGHKFIIVDYSAIEARVIAWLAGEEWVLDEFKGEGKIYEATAAQMFGVDKQKIAKGNPEYDLRAKGKVATLACGYQGGVSALIAMGALNYGLHESELEGIVNKWRQANSQIVRLWRTVENAAIDAVKGKQTRINKGVLFTRDGSNLLILLPSGRYLVYREPLIKTDAKFNKDGVTYMGNDQTSRQYIRQKTYGGKLTENIVQAIARDCLRDALLEFHRRGHKIVMHVHDEIVIETPIDGLSLDEAIEIMSITPSWAPGLPLTAAGFEAEYYQKD